MKGFEIHRNDYVQDPNWMISGPKFSFEQLSIRSPRKNNAPSHLSTVLPSKGEKKSLPAMWGRVSVNEAENKFLEEENCTLFTPLISGLRSVIKGFL